MIEHHPVSILQVSSEITLDWLSKTKEQAHLHRLDIAGVDTANYDANYHKVVWSRICQQSLEKRSATGAIKSPISTTAVSVG
jgi:hypothetical protein